MTTGNGKMTVLAQIAAGVAAITEADFRAPDRKAKRGDNIIGTAPFHVKALFTFGQKLADPMNEETSPLLKVIKNAQRAAIEAGVSSSEEFDKFLEEHPEMKAAADRVDELMKKAEPTGNLIKAVEALIRAELVAAFSEVDQKHRLMIDNDWNVVYNDHLEGASVTFSPRSWMTRWIPTLAKRPSFVRHATQRGSASEGCGPRFFNTTPLLLRL